MPPFFHIEMLPARHGDCLWIEYGQGQEVYRILIDGGPVSTYEYIEKRIKQMPAGDKAFELIVLTHVDADHIEGLVRLFAGTPLPFTVDQVWFNGWRQLEQAHGLLGAIQGEFLSALLVRRAPQAWQASAKPWVVPTKGQLPRLPLPGGMVLTLISPTPRTLKKMARAWKSGVDGKIISPGDLEAAWRALAKRKKFLPQEGLLGAAPDLDSLLKEQFPKDQRAPNGSSIAFLAEYAGKSALFLADAHPQVVSRTIKRLLEERGADQLPVNAVKVSHHGSKHNTTAALLKLLQSPAYLISTNGGGRHAHPDPECLAQIVRHGQPNRLFFNYRSESTKEWLTKAAQDKHSYKAFVRPKNALSLQVQL